jgi:hypothetical protein
MDSVLQHRYVRAVMALLSASKACRAVVGYNIDWSYAKYLVAMLSHVSDV